MKKLILTTITCLFAAAAIAQPTLTAANFNPSFWEKYVTRDCDTTGVTPGASGANVTWNFTTLISGLVDTARLEPCSATPHCSLFPGSTYAIISGHTDLIPYYIAGSTKLSQNGYYISVDTNGVYSDPIDQVQYPFTYGNSYKDPYAGIITLGAITAHETGTITVTCDAYGTLNLPGGITQTNVLRVYTTQIFADSANLFGTPVIENFKIETYTWYMPNYHCPLLNILTTTQIGGGIYNKLVTYTSQALLATPALSQNNTALQLYPNPTQGRLNIQYNTAGTEHVRIDLLDIMGREAAILTDEFSQGAQDLSYNTTALPKGLYIVRLRSGTETITRKIEVQ